MQDWYEKLLFIFEGDDMPTPSLPSRLATTGSPGRLSKVTSVSLMLLLLTLSVTLTSCCPAPQPKVVIVGKSEIRRLSTGDYVVPAARMQRLMERCGRCAQMLKECSQR